MADYLPKKNGELATWLNNFATKLPTYATVLGISDADKSALITMSNAGHDAVELKDAKWNEYLSGISDAQQTIDNAVSAVRRAVRGMKASKNYTDAIGEDLGIVAGNTPVDPASIKPNVIADTAPGEVAVKFSKAGADSVNLYSRRAGQAAWQLVSRATVSPFADDTPLAQANVPEQREYCARGLIADDEVGQMSDAVSVVFAG
jgi:hypothetical protein